MVIYVEFNEYFTSRHSKINRKQYKKYYYFFYENVLATVGNDTHPIRYENTMLSTSLC